MLTGFKKFYNAESSSELTHIKGNQEGYEYESPGLSQRDQDSIPKSQSSKKR